MEPLARRSRADLDVELLGEIFVSTENCITDLNAAFSTAHAPRMLRQSGWDLRRSRRRVFSAVTVISGLDNLNGAIIALDKALMI